MRRRGGFLKSLGIFILCLTAPAALICTPLIISNFKKSKVVKPSFRIENECVQYTQDKGKTWNTVVTFDSLMEDYGLSGNGIKSVTINETKSDETKTTYVITFSNNETYEFVVYNGVDGEQGKGISKIEKDEENSDETKTTYVITFTDESTFSYEVLNGTNGTLCEITIGENGNWFINGEDSREPARGPQGDKGDTGADGKGIKSITIDETRTNETKTT